MINALVLLPAASWRSATAASIVGNNAAITMMATIMLIRFVTRPVPVNEDMAFYTFALLDISIDKLVEKKGG